MSNAKQMLLSQLSDPGAKSKLAAKFGGYVRDRLREASFAEQVLPPETVDSSSCQVSPNHDSLVKIVFVEPKSRAQVVNFRGAPRTSFIRGEKVEVPFFSVMSDMFQKPEQEFLAYGFPIGKVIEDNAVKDLGEVQDREFLIHIESAVQALQAEANGAVTSLTGALPPGAPPPIESSVSKGELARAETGNTSKVYPIQRPDIVRLMKLLDGNRLQSESVLMTTVDWDDVLQWTMEDTGSQNQSESMVKGLLQNTLLGKKVIRTVKTDILRPGNVYAFTSPDFLGRFFLLNAVKFYLDKVINLVKFVAWKDIGMSIVNIAAVRKLELYPGDATSLDTGSILSAVTPVDEENLGAQNNRAGNRQFFPQVVSF